MAARRNTPHLYGIVPSGRNVLIPRGAVQRCNVPSDQTGVRLGRFVLTHLQVVKKDLARPHTQLQVVRFQTNDVVRKDIVEDFEEKCLRHPHSVVMLVNNLRWEQRRATLEFSVLGLSTFPALVPRGVGTGCSTRRYNCKAECVSPLPPSGPKASRVAGICATINACFFSRGSHNRWSCSYGLLRMHSYRNILLFDRAVFLKFLWRNIYMQWYCMCKSSLQTTVLQSVTRWIYPTMYTIWI